MIKKQIDGKTYHLPGNLTEWQEKMYVHLINWKRENITKEVGYSNYNGKQIPYDALFPEHIKSTLPHIYGQIRETVIEHQRKSLFKFHKHFFHIASSQAASINLFIPILVSRHVNTILKALKPDFQELAEEELEKGFRIEYWDEKGSEKGILGDHTQAAGTDADIGIAYFNQDNEPCLWLIEHKLAEKEFTNCGGYRSNANKSKQNCKSSSFHQILENKSLCHYHKVNNYKYWCITERNKAFFVNATTSPPCPFIGGLNQLWRNQLLGLALEQRSKFKHVYFSVVYHPDNERLHKSMNQYKQLINHNPKFTEFTSKKVIDLACNINDPLLRQWAEWYKALYKV